MEINAWKYVLLIIMKHMEDVLVVIILVLNVKALKHLIVYPAKANYS